MKIKDLTKNPNNPRTITDAKKSMLVKALARFGDLSGIVYNRKTKHLVGGHQRRDVLDQDAPITILRKYSKPTKTGTIAEGYIQIGTDRFAYREVYWDAHTEKAANIAANKGAGEWDPAKLSEWIKDLNTFDVNFDLDLTMFDSDEIKDIVGIEVAAHTRTGKTGVDEDELPEMPEPTTKPGDLYLLGEHRLLCGDSTSAGAVARLMNEAKADITFTSPPYNLGTFKVTGKATNKIVEPQRKQKYLTVTDDLTPEAYEKFLLDFINIALGVSESVLVNVGLMEANKRPVMRVIHTLIDQFKETLYWKKSTSTPHIQAGIVTTLVEPIFCFGKHNSRMFRTATFKGSCPNVVDGANAGGNEFAKVHSATFPVYLPEWIIENFSRGAVFDPFGGTGTTMIAAEKLRRKSFLMELDPSYCDIIVARWEKYTGLKARLVRTETKLKPATQAKAQASNGKQESKAAAQT